jgi:MoaD family protein
MKVRVQFYAQLRDLTHVQAADIDLADGGKISDLMENIYTRFPTLRLHDKTILVGTAVEFVDRSYPLKPGDEIAIMPPVQGG